MKTVKFVPLNKTKIGAVIVLVFSLLLSGCFSTTQNTSFLYGISEEALANRLLYIGISDDNLETCIEAIDKGVNIDKFGENLSIKDSSNHKETNPLLSAMGWQQYSISSYLIEKGAGVNYQNYNGTTALMLACKKCNKDITKLLLSSGANPDIKDKDNKTALDYAISSEYDEKALSEVINAFADYGFYVNEQQFALLRSNSKPKFRILQECLKNNKSNIDYGISEALQASILGNNDALEKILSDTSVDADSIKNCLPYISAFGSLENFKKAISISGMSEAKLTEYLYISAKYNNSQVAECLINNQTEYNEYTLLLNIAESGKAEILKNQAFDITIKEDEILYIMNVSAKYNNQEFLLYLIDNGYDINKGIYTGDLLGTPLDFAVNYSHYSLIEVLLENKADINGGTEKGRALRTAVINNDVEMVKFLIDNGCDVNIITTYSDGSTEPPILWEAIHKGNYQIVKLLIENGADIGAIGNSNAVLEASYQMSCNILEYTLEHSTASDINLQNENGDSALAIIVASGYTDMVKICTRFNCDKSLKNNDGKTALDIANQNNFKEIIELLN